MSKPDKKTIKNYLDNIQKSGAINMYGAAYYPYLEREFGMSREKAKNTVLAWMKDFKPRGDE